MSADVPLRRRCLLRVLFNTTEAQCCTVARCSVIE